MLTTLMGVRLTVYLSEPSKPEKGGKQYIYTGSHSPVLRKTNKTVVPMPATWVYDTVYFPLGKYGQLQATTAIVLGQFRKANRPIPILRRKWEQFLMNR